MCTFVFVRGKCLMRINHRKGKVSLVTVLPIVVIKKVLIALFYCSVFFTKAMLNITINTRLRYETGNITWNRSQQIRFFRFFRVIGSCKVFQVFIYPFAV